MNERVLNTEKSGIRKFSNKVARVDGAISLTLGQPDFDVPDAAKEAMKAAIDEGKTKYTSNEGLEELRVEISKYLKKLGVNFAPDEVCITVGGSEGLFATFLAVVNEGDKVLIPDPAYPAYKAIVEMIGGEAVLYKLNEDFSINLEELEDKLKKNHIEAMVLSYPCNPTGAVLNERDRDKLCEILRKYDVKIITDEMYAALCYEDEYYTVAQLDEFKDRIIYVSGFSKMLSMTGLRIGYVCADKKLLNEIVKAHQYDVSCASSISQYGAIAGLKYCEKDVEFMRNEFKKRRDFVYSELKDMGLDVNLPKGAFYVFPSIKKTGMTSEEFCEKLLNEKKVACVPGNAFGDGGEGYIRISYSYSIEELKKALNLIREFLEENNKSISV